MTEFALGLLLVLLALDLHSSLARAADELNGFIVAASGRATPFVALVVAKCVGVAAVVALFIVHRRIPALRLEVRVYTAIAVLAYVVVVINNYGWL